MTTLKLKQVPDVVLATGVLYDSEAFDVLVQTITDLSGIDTLVLFASVVKTRFDDLPFFEKLSKTFEMTLLPQSLMDPGIPTQGDGSCRIHVLRRKSRLL